MDGLRNTGDPNPIQPSPGGGSFQINSFRRILLENASLVLFVLAVVGLPLSLSRIHQTGLHFNHFTHIGATIIILVVFFSRKRMPENLLVFSILLIFSGLSVSALLQYGIASAGFYFSAASIFIAGIALGLWGGIICAGLNLVALFIVARMWMSGYLSFPGDVREFVLQPTVWATLGITFIITTSVFFISASGLLSGLRKQMDTISNQKKKLEERSAQLTQSNQELTEALAKVKTLSGLLPICSNCKKIRDDKGYWQQVEQFVQDHSRAEFTHSLCPDCLWELHPREAERILKKTENSDSGE